MKVTNSQSFVGEKFVPSRPLDYIYDPLFTFSGSKDFYKAAHEAHKSSSEFSVQPIFNSMFSDMVRYPSANLVVKTSHHQRTVDLSYRGKLRAMSLQRTEKPEVTGTDRYKYFRRPVTESQLVSPTSRFPLLGGERVTNVGIMAPPTTAQVQPTRSSRLLTAAQSRAVQTDYRESEAQTQPWAPPFVTQSDTPEVLYLDRLTWGDGLPPGKHEVDVVERLRKKRAWEAQLPPPDSDANIKIRYKLIAEMEKSDWLFREQEVEAVHKERIKKSGQILDQHVLINRAKLSSRMEFLEDDINKRKEKKLQMFRHEKERALRKLCMKEKGFKQRRTNMIDELLNHTSQLYAPKDRLGSGFKTRDLVLSEKSINIDRRDLRRTRVTKYRPVFDFERLSKPKIQTGLCFHETRWNMDNLIKLHHDLQALRKKARGWKSQLDALVNQAKVQQAPKLLVNEIPSVPMMVESTEKLYQAATLIQRIVQGRAMQSMMYLRRERWKDTMTELRAIESMTKEQLAECFAQKSLIIQDKRLAGMLEDVIGLNVGLTIGQTLDLLAKELLRIKNETIGRSQALQAEHERWNREGAEGGRRQREMRIREEQGLMFSQLMEMYQDSINEFMEAVIIRARENEAKTQALEYAKEMARLAELEEARRLAKLMEPVTADALFEFIAPEGLRALTRTCMLILRQKYLEARQHLVDTCRAESLPEPIVSKSTTEEDEQEHKFIITPDLIASKSTTEEDEQEHKPINTQDLIASKTTPEEDEQEHKPIITPDKDQISLMDGEELYFTKSFGDKSGETSRTSLETDDKDSELPQLVSRCIPSVDTFGLETPALSLEDRLLANVMQDMCYVAGALFKTAAKILNNALCLAGIPRESFEEALIRTMHVINEARDEVVRLIIPPRSTVSSSSSSSTRLVSEEIIMEATKIVDEIIRTAKERIKERQRYFESDAQLEVKEIIEDLLKEAQQQVFQAIVEDFIYDLLAEADKRVNFIRDI